MAEEETQGISQGAKSNNFSQALQNPIQGFGTFTGSTRRDFGGQLPLQRPRHQGVMNTGNFQFPGFGTFNGNLSDSVPIPPQALQNPIQGFGTFGPSNRREFTGQLPLQRPRHQGVMNTGNFQFPGFGTFNNTGNLSDSNPIPPQTASYNPNFIIDDNDKGLNYNPNFIIDDNNNGWNYPSMGLAPNFIIDDNNKGWNYPSMGLAGAIAPMGVSGAIAPMGQQSSVTHDPAFENWASAYANRTALRGAGVSPFSRNIPTAVPGYGTIPQKHLTKAGVEPSPFLQATPPHLINVNRPYPDIFNKAGVEPSPFLQATPPHLINVNRPYPDIFNKAGVEPSPFHKYYPHYTVNRPDFGVGSPLSNTRPDFGRGVLTAPRPPANASGTQIFPSTSGKPIDMKDLQNIKLCLDRVRRLKDITEFDVRRIASKGNLAPLIDRHNTGIHETTHHSSGLTTHAKIIEFAPIAQELIVIGPILRLPLTFCLPQGCWLLKYQPVGFPSQGWFSYHMDGTLRVEHTSWTTVKASGDLYGHLKINFPWWPNTPEPDPGSGKVPIFSRSRYNCYLRVTSVSMVTLNRINVEFERHTLNSSNNWIIDSGYSATMDRQTLSTSSPYPHKNRYFKGDVYQGSTKVASLTMGWICPQFRQIVLELDSVSASPLPVTTSTGYTWDTLFDDVNYGADIVCSDTSVSETSGQSWNSSELHAAMLANRETTNLDREWRYHLFFVRGLDMTDRGIMYDYSADSNDTPREGAAVASHWVFPSSGWGNVSGDTFHTTDGYMRTAIHELGHAFNLLHNYSQTHYMRTTPSINSAAKASTPFPTNVSWSYSPDDLDRLRHWPDPVVRPGGLEFAAIPYSSIPISDANDPILLPSPDLKLDIQPLRATVPLGAPVRFRVTCTNTSKDQAVPGPFVLSLANPNFRGGVSPHACPDDVNHFSSLFKCNDGQYDEPSAYEPNQSRSSSITLLRGSNGPLFSEPGLHRVFVELSWLLDGGTPDSIPIRFLSRAECYVMVSPPKNDGEANQAFNVLTCPNLLPAFVFGTPLAKLDPATRRAISTAMNAPALRSHFAVLKARWYRAQRQYRTGTPLKLEDGAVLTESERIKVDALTRMGEQNKTESSTSNSATTQSKENC